MRPVLCVVAFAALVCAVLFPWQGNPAAGELSVGDVFQQVEGRYASLSTLTYTVKRTVTLKNGRASEDRWVFRYKKPDFIRIDYQSPHERLLILDGKMLLEYIPQIRKAMKTDLAVMPREKREKTVAEVMAHVSVDGLRVGNYAEMEKRTTGIREVTWGGQRAYLIEGVDPRYVLYIDKVKSALLRSEIYDKKGGLVIRTEASRFIEVAKGFWVPQEIQAAYSTPEGLVQSTTLLRDIKINEAMADSLFDLSLPKGVNVILN